jgi:hypothetical protein
MGTRDETPWNIVAAVPGDLNASDVADLTEAIRSLVAKRVGNRSQEVWVKAPSAKANKRLRQHMNGNPEFEVTHKDLDLGTWSEP